MVVVYSGELVWFFIVNDWLLFGFSGNGLIKFVVLTARMLVVLFTVPLLRLKCCAAGYLCIVAHCFMRF